jgi:hypothetical protein
MPKILSRAVDVEIPLTAWSAWKPTDGPRLLRRPLTPTERQALQSRRAELEPWMAGYHPSEADEVALALLDMFGSFPSMRGKAGEAAARGDAAMRLLREQPAWAIVKACREIQAKGVFREDRYERQWPPSDPELMEAVRHELRLYEVQYRSAIALLEATT